MIHFNHKKFINATKTSLSRIKSVGLQCHLSVCTRPGSCQDFNNEFVLKMKQIGSVFINLCLKYQ